MITQIDKLRNFGIFRDYKPSKELHPFNKFNLFYGWNGSGKSTLSKLFQSLEDKNLLEHYTESEFAVTAEDHQTITNKNLSNNTLNIRVFNKEFVKRNVNFEQSKANSILILSEEKKGELDEYKTVLVQQQTKLKSLNALRDENKKKEEDLKRDLSKWAVNIKKSFELIETTNSYYLNYDRTKLGNLIKTKKTELGKDKILTPQQVKELKNTTNPNKKVDIVVEQFASINIDELSKEIIGIQDILSKSVFSKQIEKLVADSDLNSWVQDGVLLHERTGSATCEFCGKKLEKERLEELNNHFSKDYTEMLDQLKNQRKYIDEVKSKINIKTPDRLEYYDELGEECTLLSKAHMENIKHCEEIIETIIQRLEEKIQNPFQVTNYKFGSYQDVFMAFNDSLKSIENVSKKHNLKNQGFDNAVKSAQQLLENHFVSETLLTEDYQKREDALLTLRKEIEGHEQDYSTLTKKVTDLEAVLLSETVGSTSFNKALEKFLGRKDISLEFDKQLKGYKIIRGTSTSAALNLSEGECTAIAFVYFVSKLKENGNQISDTIIVVDDPISSFDSNHLFHSYSYLKSECEKSKQIFLLTHNFQYFKLLRDWLLKKNDKKWNPASKTYDEKIKSRFYSLECTSDEDRNSSLANADTTLLQFNSEYHFIFYKLHELKSAGKLNIEKAFLIANLSRKLLESFLTFKFPKGRHDFHQLLQEGCTDDEVREKVYRFINKYSHNQQIDFQDSPIDNLLGEGQNIIVDVFKIVSELDSPHYNEMIELVEKT